jgi:hypothetical protein
MPRRSIALLLLVSASTLTGLLQADAKLDAVVSHLSKVDVFAFGGVGYAGVTSQGELDFRAIVSQPIPVALAAFEMLYVTGNPQAKAYAIVGFKKLDPNRYRELLSFTKDSADQVAVMRGCIINREALAKVVQEIEKGEFAPTADHR